MPLSLGWGPCSLSPPLSMITTLLTRLIECWTYVGEAEASNILLIGRDMGQRNVNGFPVPLSWTPLSATTFTPVSRIDRVGRQVASLELLWIESTRQSGAILNLNQRIRKPDCLELLRRAPDANCQSVCVPTVYSCKARLPQIVENVDLLSLRYQWVYRVGIEHVGSEEKVEHGRDLELSATLQTAVVALCRTTGKSEERKPREVLTKLTPDDDVETYVTLFERTATREKWPKTAWAAVSLDGSPAKTTNDDREEAVHTQYTAADPERAAEVEPLEDIQSDEVFSQFPEVEMEGNLRPGQFGSAQLQDPDLT
ncbi:unnamed protein product [Pleuronectes platessa]|uniref:Uncharacterized protein n=1 Tax=Pleuronectes platessa TaxID=8262 RepID=A0A9N7TZC2_PLEPL|nr:unnamed protein product [Pleuronectes platessa]